jgi:hypothetical protein
MVTGVLSASVLEVQADQLLLERVKLRKDRKLGNDLLHGL